MRILCVKWGTKYGPEYVTKLKAACERHIPHDEFICVTDDPVEGVDCYELVCALPGWWQKVGLFQAGMFPGWNLYLDLDVVITSGIDALIESAEKGKLSAINDFSYPVGNPLAGQIAGLVGDQGTINSSIMLWYGEAGSPVQAVWERFDESVMETLHGDQNWITQVLWPAHLSLLPSGHVLSYRYGKAQKAPIVVFHGNPKPHEAGAAWISENW